MKKIISFLFALVMMMTVANAQTVENNGVFSKMYIGLSAGANHNPVSDYSNFNFNALKYNAALEIGKDVTPITGFSLQGIANADFIDGFNFNRIDVFGNTKFNLMNLFGGYKGYPRRVEIRTVTGIGWNYNMNTKNQDIALQGGLEFDFNLGKNRNWYITFTPMVQMNEILASYSDIEPMVKNADLKANVGIVYRLGHGDSHNFKLCPYAYTSEQYDILYAKYDECMNKPAQIDTVEVVKEVTVEVVKVVSDDNDLNFVPFVKGSANIEGIGREMLDYIVHNLSADAQIDVIGSADSSTGSKEFNEKLALERANAVAAALKANGFDNVTVSNVLDKFETAEMSRCAVIVKK